MFRLLLCLGYCTCCCEHWGACIFSDSVVFSGCLPRNVIAGSIVSFWGPFVLFSIVAALIYIPTNSVGGFPSLHTLSLYLLFKYFYISWWSAFAQAPCQASLPTFLELPEFPCEPGVFSRQEYGNGSPFPSPGDLPDPGIEPRAPVLQADSLRSEPPGKPVIRSLKAYFQPSCLSSACAEKFLSILDIASAPGLAFLISEIKV